MALEVRLHEKILYVSLNHPERRNSFGVEEADKLVAALDKHQDEVQGLIFYAQGSTFCSGGNLDDYAQMKTAAQGRAANRKIRAALEKLEQWHRPTVAVVEGDCFGGGVELLSAFDYVIAAPYCFFGLWQRRQGLSLGWGGGERLLKRLEMRDLQKLLLSARTMTSLEAFQVGLIDEMAVPEMLAERAQEWIRVASGWPRQPVRSIKTFDPRTEQKEFEKLWWSDEHRRKLNQRLNKAAGRKNIRA